MTSRIANLSNRALQLAVSLPTTETARLARWLYHYGNLPRRTTFEHDFGFGDNAMAVLGLTSGDVARRKLETTYEATTYPGWLSFALASRPVLTQAACKLYVSPQPHALAAAFPIIAQTFVDMDVRSFKVGRRIEGLLRSDKIVAYFNNRDELHAVANTLCVRLKGCPVQGVPFTADAGLDGLVSWGIDPPLGAKLVSWRSWITKQLANEIVKARLTTGYVTIANVLAAITNMGVNTAEWSVINSDPFYIGASE